MVPFVAIFLTSLNLRALVTALAPLIPEVQTSLGLSTTIIGFIGSLPSIMFALAAFASPRMLKQLSIAQVLALAMAATGLAQILRVLGPSTFTLMVGTAAALFAVGIANAVIPLAVREYFPHAVPRMTMMYLISMQITMTSAPVVVVRDFIPNWQYGLGLWAVFGISAAVAWLPLTRRAPVQHTVVPVETHHLPVWKTPVGWGVAVMFGFTSFNSYILMAFLPAVFVDAGASQQFGGAMLALWGLIGLVIGVVGPWVVGKFQRVFPIIVIAMISFIVGNLGLILSPLSLPYLWVILSGFGPLSFPIALTLVNVRARSMQGATSLSAFGQGMGYTIAATGPLLVGAIFDFTGTYTFMAYVLTFASVAIGMAAWFATKQVYVEDQLHIPGEAVHVTKLHSADKSDTTK